MFRSHVLHKLLAESLKIMATLVSLYYIPSHIGGRFSQRSPWGSQENLSKTEKIPTLSLLKATQSLLFQAMHKAHLK